MTTLFINIGQLLRVSRSGELNKRGASMHDLCILQDAAMLVDESILWIGPHARHVDVIAQADTVIDCGGRVVMPGFVDSHSHVVFAGNRSDEFARRLHGVSYAQIASEGGGILSTMRAVRAATEDELFRQAHSLATSAMQHGTTTLEIKSGYALETAGELKMLRAIGRVRESLPLTVHRTFLGAHDVPPEYAHDREAYVALVCEEMIPRVAEEDLAATCDVFCDTGYFTVEQSREILAAARRSGLQTKVHADELS
ncbi:MAG: amidohydrolase family protein, partial [Candidatus Kapaibacterium sp.]